MYSSRVFETSPGVWKYEIARSGDVIQNGLAYGERSDAQDLLNRRLLQILNAPLPKDPPTEGIRRFEGDPWGDRDQKWLSSGGAFGSILIECNEGTGVRYMGARLLNRDGAKVYEQSFPVPKGAAIVKHHVCA